MDNIQFQRMENAVGTTQRTCDLVVRGWLPLLAGLLLFSSLPTGGAPAPAPRQLPPTACPSSLCVPPVLWLLVQVKCRPIPGTEGSREFVFSSIER